MTAPADLSSAIREAEEALAEYDRLWGSPAPTNAYGRAVTGLATALRALLAATTPGPDDPVGTMERLLQSVATAEKLQTKTNEELADLVREHVWAECSLDSPRSDLLGEVMNRLRGLKTCPACKGWGYVEYVRCTTCAGTGDVEPAPAAASEEALAAFGRALLPKWWDDGDAGDIDGGDAQDAAEAAGLWHRVERHAPGVECEWCNNEEPCGELTEAGLSALASRGGSR